MKRKSYVAIILAVMLILTYSPIYKVQAAADQTVTLASSLDAQLEDVQYFQKTNTLSFSIIVNNKSSNMVDFIDYWARIVKKDGSTVNVKAVESDSTRIAPYTSKSYMFYANVGKIEKPSDLRIQMIKWDFSQTDLEKTVGQFNIPSSYDLMPVQGEDKEIIVEETTISSKVNRISMSSMGQAYQTNISLTFENTGNYSVTLPSYKFYVVTGDNIYYSLTGDDTNKVIAAKTKLTINLNSQIPTKVDVKKLKLIITSVLENKTELQVGGFQLSDATPGSNNVDSTYEYTNEDGIYQIAMKSIQRLPWEDKDILSAEITLTNLSNTTLPIPDLNANYYLDGIQIDTEAVKVILLDKVFGIKANQSVNIIITTKIPYTYDFKNMRLQLLEKRGDQERSIVDYSQNTTQFSLPIIKENSTYAIEQLGRRAGVTIHDSKVYSSTNSQNQLMYVDVEFKNLERRSALLQNFVAYFRAADETYFPALLTEYKSNLQPGANLLLSVSGNIPKRYNISDMSLVFGQGITGTELSENDTSDSYIKAVNFELKDTQAPVEDSLNNVELYPYTFDFRKIRAFVVNDHSFQVDFEYDKSTDNLYDNIADNHKLVIEIVDDQTRAEKKFDLEDTTAELYLKPGEKNKASVIFEDSNYFYYRLFNDFTLNIYDEFNDHRKLIASKTLKWFVTSD